MAQQRRTLRKVVALLTAGLTGIAGQVVAIPAAAAAAGSLVTTECVDTAGHTASDCGSITLSLEDGTAYDAAGLEAKTTTTSENTALAVAGFYLRNAQGTQQVPLAQVTKQGETLKAVPVGAPAGVMLAATDAQAQLVVQYRALDTANKVKVTLNPGTVKGAKFTGANVVAGVGYYPERATQASFLYEGPRGSSLELTADDAQPADNAQLILANDSSTPDTTRQYWQVVPAEGQTNLPATITVSAVPAGNTTIAVAAPVTNYRYFPDLNSDKYRPFYEGKLTISDQQVEPDSDDKRLTSKDVAAGGEQTFYVRSTLKPARTGSAEFPLSTDSVFNSFVRTIQLVPLAVPAAAKETQFSDTNSRAAGTAVSKFENLFQRNMAVVESKHLPYRAFTPYNDRDNYVTWLKGELAKFETQEWNISSGALAGTSVKVEYTDLFNLDTDGNHLCSAGVSNEATAGSQPNVLGYCMKVTVQGVQAKNLTVSLGLFSEERHENVDPIDGSGEFHLDSRELTIANNGSRGITLNRIYPTTTAYDNHILEKNAFLLGTDDNAGRGNPNLFGYRGLQVNPALITGYGTYKTEKHDENISLKLDGTAPPIAYAMRYGWVRVNPVIDGFYFNPRTSWLNGKQSEGCIINEDRSCPLYLGFGIADGYQKDGLQITRTNSDGTSSPLTAGLEHLTQPKQGEDGRAPDVQTYNWWKIPAGLNRADLFLGNLNPNYGGGELMSYQVIAQPQKFTVTVQQKAEASQDDPTQDFVPAENPLLNVELIETPQAPEDQRFVGWKLQYDQLQNNGNWSPKSSGTIYNSENPVLDFNQLVTPVADSGKNNEYANRRYSRSDGAPLLQNIKLIPQFADRSQERSAVTYEVTRATETGNTETLTVPAITGVNMVFAESYATWGDQALLDSGDVTTTRSIPTGNDLDLTMNYGNPIRPPADLETTWTKAGAAHVSGTVDDQAHNLKCTNLAGQSALGTVAADTDRSLTLTGASSGEAISCVTVDPATGKTSAAVTTSLPARPQALGISKLVATSSSTAQVTVTDADEDQVDLDTPGDTKTLAAAAAKADVAVELAAGQEVVAYSKTAAGFSAPARLQLLAAPTQVAVKNLSAAKAKLQVTAPAGADQVTCTLTPNNAVADGQPVTLAAAESEKELTVTKEITAVSCFATKGNEQNASAAAPFIKSSTAQGMVDRLLPQPTIVADARKNRVAVTSAAGDSARLELAGQKVAEDTTKVNNELVMSGLEPALAPKQNLTVMTSAAAGYTPNTTAITIPEAPSAKSFKLQVAEDGATSISVLGAEPAGSTLQCFLPGTDTVVITIPAGGAREVECVSKTDSGPVTAISPALKLSLPAQPAFPDTKVVRDDRAAKPFQVTPQVPAGGSVKQVNPDTGAVLAPQPEAQNGTYSFPADQGKACFVYVDAQSNSSAKKCFDQPDAIPAPQIKQISHENPAAPTVTVAGQPGQWVTVYDKDNPTKIVGKVQIPAGATTAQLTITDPVQQQLLAARKTLSAIAQDSETNPQRISAPAEPVTIPAAPVLQAVQTDSQGTVKFTLNDKAGTPKENQELVCQVAGGKWQPVTPDQNGFYQLEKAAGKDLACRIVATDKSVDSPSGTATAAGVPELAPQVTRGPKAPGSSDSELPAADVVTIKVPEPKQGEEYTLTNLPQGAACTPDADQPTSSGSWQCTGLPEAGRTATIKVDYPHGTAAEVPAVIPAALAAPVITGIDHSGANPTVTVQAPAGSWVTLTAGGKELGKVQADREGKAQIVALTPAQQALLGAGQEVSAQATNDPTAPTSSSPVATATVAAAPQLAAGKLPASTAADGTVQLGYAAPTAPAGATSKLLYQLPGETSWQEVPAAGTLPAAAAGKQVMLRVQNTWPQSENTPARTIDSPSIAVNVPAALAAPTGVKTLNEAGQVTVFADPVPAGVTTTASFSCGEAETSHEVALVAAGKRQQAALQCPDGSTPTGVNLHNYIGSKDQPSSISPAVAAPVSKPLSSAPTISGLVQQGAPGATGLPQLSGKATSGKAVQLAVVTRDPADPERSSYAVKNGPVKIGLEDSYSLNPDQVQELYASDLKDGTVIAVRAVDAAQPNEITATSSWTTATVPTLGTLSATPVASGNAAGDVKVTATGIKDATMLRCKGADQAEWTVAPVAGDPAGITVPGAYGQEITCQAVNADPQTGLTLESQPGKVTSSAYSAGSELAPTVVRRGSSFEIPQLQGADPAKETYLLYTPDGAEQPLKIKLEQTPAGSWQPAPGQQLAPLPASATPITFFQHDPETGLDTAPQTVTVGPLLNGVPVIETVVRPDQENNADQQDQQPAAVVTGKVLSDSGLPLAGQKIVLFDDKGTLIGQAETTAQGTYSIPVAASNKASLAAGKQLQVQVVSGNPIDNYGETATTTIPAAPQLAAGKTPGYDQAGNLQVPLQVAGAPKGATVSCRTSSGSWSDPQPLAAEAATLSFPAANLPAQPLSCRTLAAGISSPTAQLGAYPVLDAAPTGIIYTAGESATVSWPCEPPVKLVLAGQIISGTAASGRCSAKVTNQQDATKLPVQIISPTGSYSAPTQLQPLPAPEQVTTAAGTITGKASNLPAEAVRAILTDATGKVIATTNVDPQTGEFAFTDLSDLDRTQGKYQVGFATGINEQGQPNPDANTVFGPTSPVTWMTQPTVEEAAGNTIRGTAPGAETVTITYQDEQGNSQETQLPVVAGKYSSAALSPALAPGTLVTVTATDAGGNQSEPQQVFTAPAITTVTATKDAQPATVVGTAAAGSTVLVTYLDQTGTTQETTVTADQTGKWTLQLPADAQAESPVTATVIAVGDVKAPAVARATGQIPAAAVSAPEPEPVAPPAGSSQAGKCVATDSWTIPILALLGVMGAVGILRQVGIDRLPQVELPNLLGEHLPQPVQLPGVGSSMPAELERVGDLVAEYAPKGIAGLLLLLLIAHYRDCISQLSS